MHVYCFGTLLSMVQEAVTHLTRNEITCTTNPYDLQESANCVRSHITDSMQQQLDLIALGQK